MVSAGSSPRYGVARAPDGLGFVEDFINTKAAGAYGLTDQLDTPAGARAWLREAAGAWARDRGCPIPKITLTGAALPSLRMLRNDVQALVADADLSAAAVRRLGGSASFGVAAGGAIVVSPQGRGEQWVASVVSTELWQAQLRGTRHRLKICRSPECAVAFYDRSRNSSGVWHDVNVCGNVMNLRAFRARQRSTR